MADAFARGRRGVATRVAAGLFLGCLAIGVSGQRSLVDDHPPAKLHAADIRPIAGQRSDPAAPASTGLRIAPGPGGDNVRLAGELTEGAAERLRAVLDAHPGVARIHLTSEGGLVEEGRAIGALVAARGLDTYVPDYCVSACTLSFMRGVQRFIRSESRLGFHAPYEDGPAGTMFAADASDERADYLAAGLDAGFVAEALAVPSRDLWIPGVARLLDSGIATDLVDAERFPDSTLDHAPDLGGARQALLNGVDGARALEEAGRLDTLAALYLAAYRAGRSEAEIARALHRIADPEAAQARQGGPAPLAGLTR